MKPAYYNEFNPRAAAALRQLIADGLIAPGDVDERSILDVCPDDLTPYAQVHLFAGFGGWSHALRLARVPDDEPWFTLSCPCQPFSAAGAGGGFADERHLWPAAFHLIAQCRPRRIVGEQVDAAIRYGWLDLVQDDMEAIGYAFAAAGLPAACVGAPHIRQRLWFVADCAGDRRREERADAGRLPQGNRAQGWAAGSESSSVFGELADTDLRQRDGIAELRGDVRDGSDGRRSESCGVVGSRSENVGVAMGDAERTGLAQCVGHPGVPGGACGADARQAVERAGVHVGAMADSDGRDAGTEREQRFESSDGRSSFWSTARWLACRDGKWRPVEPSIFPLAHGVPERVPLLHAAGNGIVPQVAAAFIEEYLAIDEPVKQ